MELDCETAIKRYQQTATRYCSIYNTNQRANTFNRATNKSISVSLLYTRFWRVVPAFGLWRRFHYLYSRSHEIMMSLSFVCSLLSALFLANEFSSDSSCSLPRNMIDYEKSGANSRCVLGASISHERLLEIFISIRIPFRPTPMVG